METKIETTKAHQAFSSSHACYCGPPLLLPLLLLGWFAPVRTAAAADCAAPSFAAARTFGSGGPGPRSVTVGDFNGDGRPDIVGQAGTTTFTDTNAVGAGSFFYRVGVLP